MPIRVASRIFRGRTGFFYFRLVFPDDIALKVRQRELRFSLFTEQRHEAIARALPLIADIPRLLSEFRRMADHDDTPSPQYFREWIEEKRLNIHLRAKVDELEGRLVAQQRELLSSVPRKSAQQVVKSAYDKGQLKGKVELEQRLVFPWSPERTPLFSELKIAYLTHLRVRAKAGARKPPTAKTMESYEKEIGFFEILMGDLRIGEIDEAMAGAFFSLMTKLPANISRKKEFKGKSVEDLLALSATPQSEANCSKKMERISTVFKWALEEKRKWGIDANPFKGYGQSSGAATKRRPFTWEELEAILGHKSFVSRRFTSTYSYWMIPLGLFSGARLGEIAQLDLKDFVEVEGIHCIDINDIDAFDIVEGTGKKLKTKNAKRLVPIHSELIRLGLLRYVDYLKERGESQLFPELSRTRRDGPGHAVSNWFQRHRATVGIKEKQQTVFHSFRHLFITNILDRDVAPHMVAPIVGHEADLITGKVYWNKKDATKRQPTVESFSLPAKVARLIPSIEEVTFVVSPGPRIKRSPAS